MKFFNELTLKNKIFISCLGFTLLVSILIALFTRGLLIAGLTGELQKRGIGIAQSVADSSRVARDIAAEIAGVNGAAGEMAASSQEASTGAEELSRLAAQLKEMVGRFKV